MNPLRIVVIIPTRNPNRERLHEVLDALRKQDLPATAWELCLLDNGSTPALEPDLVDGFAHAQVVRETRPGLLWARLTGLRRTSAPVLVFIDDDTVPHPHFLSAAVEFMDAHPHVATAGGKILPRFLAAPPDWLEHAGWALALRDNGSEPLTWSQAAGGDLPHWTPIGAGLIVRRAALEPAYVTHVETHAALIERISWKGQGCGGVEDKDLVLHCLRRGWATGYTPAAVLTHIIPPNRLELSYFEKLIPAVQTLWARTLFAHGFNTRAPIPWWMLPLRQLKAWFAFKAWQSPTNRLQWLAACGFLAGLAAIARDPVRYPAATDDSP